MAFTHVLLPLLLVASATAIFPSGLSGAALGGSLGGAALGGTPLGGASLGGASLGGASLGGSAVGGSSFGSLGGGGGGGGIYGQSQQSKRGYRIATMRAKNLAGDQLMLNFLEQIPSSGFGNSGLFPGAFSQFAKLPFLQGAGGSAKPELRVVGRYMKKGAISGVTSTDSLQGSFAMVVMENGNTDGSCIGTGKPLVLKNHHSHSKFGSFPGVPFSGGYAGLVGGYGGFARGIGGFHPLHRGFTGGYAPGFGGVGKSFFPQQQQQQPQPLVVTTRLMAVSNTASIEGKLYAKLKDLYGRALQVCSDMYCQYKTDMCGVIGHDSFTIEEFAQYQHTQTALASIKASGALSSNNLGSANYNINNILISDDDDNDGSNALNIGF